MSLRRRHCRRRPRRRRRRRASTGPCEKRSESIPDWSRCHIFRRAWLPGPPIIQRKCRSSPYTRSPIDHAPTLNPAAMRLESSRKPQSEVVYSPLLSFSIRLLKSYSSRKPQICLCVNFVSHKHVIMLPPHRDVTWRLVQYPTQIRSAENLKRLRGSAQN